MNNINATLELSKEEMKTYGYQVVDAIIEHFDTQNNKFPVAAEVSREEMNLLFLEEAPEYPSNPLKYNILYWTK